MGDYVNPIKNKDGYKTWKGRKGGGRLLVLGIGVVGRHFLKRYGTFAKFLCSNGRLGVQ